MLLLDLRRAALPLALLLAGCSSQGDTRTDGGPRPDAGVVPTAELVVTTDASIALQFGEEAELQVLYREISGEPIANEEVRFALVGRANDSSLSALRATTDGAGMASVRVTAGRTASSFRVRMSADRAASVSVDVAVSDAGFGGLDVVVEWMGARPVEARRVSVFSGERCRADLDSTLADRSQSVASDAESASFVALPAGLEYAVLAEGLGPTGAVVANGCTDGIVIVADTDVDARVTMMDLPLVVAGEYATEVSIRAGTGPTELERSVQRGGRSSIEAAGGGASFLLDAVEEHLRAAGDIDGADAVAAARTSGLLDTMLDDELTLERTGPERAIDAIATEMAMRTQTIALAGAAGIAASPDAFDTTFRTTGLSTHPDGDPTGRLTLDIDAIALDTNATLLLVAGLREGELGVELGAPLPLGAIGVATLAALAAEAGHASTTELFAARAGCETFTAWGAGEPAIAVACDATCLDTVCSVALGVAVADIEAALLALDATRAAIALSGTMMARDELGDLRIDTLEARELAGSWSSADGTSSEPVTASLAGSRMLE